MRSLLPLIVCLLVSPVSAVDFALTDQLEVSDLDGLDDDERDGQNIGEAVAITGSTAWFGAPGANQVGGRFEGAAFRATIGPNGDFGTPFLLTPMEPDPFRFGDDIAADGDWTAVGYRTDNQIDLYRRTGTGWVFVKSLLPPEPEGIEIRGMSADLDLRGDLLVAAASSSRIDGVGNAGAVVVFERNEGGTDNWGVAAVLTAPVVESGTDFATAVSGQGDVIAVTDDLEERAYVYRRTGGEWSFDEELTPLGSEKDDAFGTAVAVEGGTIVVGATNGNNVQQPSNSGSVHVFHLDAGSFSQVAELAPSQPDFIDRFGDDAVLRDGLLVVGAPGANQVYVFADLGAGWTELDMVTPPEVPFGNVNFGIDVGYERGRLIVGANRWDDQGDRFGAVFLFEAPAIVLCGIIDGIFCDRFESGGP
jgi:hypothetical protein